jgi:purine nucleosidase
VASGQARPTDGREPFWGGWEGKGFLAEDEVVGGITPQAAPVLMVDVLQRAAEPVVIVSVGGLSNVAEALRQAPAIKSKIRRLVIMGGCVRPFLIEGKTLPERLETNLHNDADAAAKVLQSGIPITLVPAEVTFKTKLLNADRARLRQADTRLAKGMTAMTDEWEPRLAQFMTGFGVSSYYQNGSVMLHDPLAVATLIDDSLVKIVPERIRIEVDKGKIRTVVDPLGPIAIDLVIEADIAKLSRMVSDAVVK